MEMKEIYKGDFYDAFNIDGTMVIAEPGAYVHAMFGDGWMFKCDRLTGNGDRIQIWVRPGKSEK